MKYYENPEMIAVTKVVDTSGNEDFLGDKILSVAVNKDRDVAFEGTAVFDLRKYNKKGDSILIEVSLPDLMKAITAATLNANRE